MQIFFNGGRPLILRFLSEFITLYAYAIKSRVNISISGVMLRGEAEKTQPDRVHLRLTAIR